LPLINSVVRDWIILVVVILILTGAGALLSAFVSPGAGALVTAVGWGLLGVFGIFDGIRRVLGRSSFLGQGRGLSRWLGGVQVLLSFALLVTILTSLLAS
jgi:hypothetical protein